MESLNAYSRRNLPGNLPGNGPGQTPGNLQDQQELPTYQEALVLLKEPNQFYEAQFAISIAL